MPLKMSQIATLRTGNVVRDSIVESFIRESPFLAALPIDNIQGAGYDYDVEAELPGVMFRGFNEAFDESTGIINPQHEKLFICGGDIKVDKSKVKLYGQRIRSQQETMKAKAMGQILSSKIFKGDNQTSPREPDGLQARITGPQLIAAGATSGGDALSLSKLDQALDRVPGANAIGMSQAMIRRFTQAHRTPTVGGHIDFTKNDFGTPLTTYAGKVLLPVDGPNIAVPTLGFNEANPGGGAAVGTSIYPIRAEIGFFSLFQNGGIDVRDLGETQVGPWLLTRVDWHIGIRVENMLSVARIWGIKDAPIVA